MDDDFVDRLLRAIRRVGEERRGLDEEVLDLLAAADALAVADLLHRLAQSSPTADWDAALGGLFHQLAIKARGNPIPWCGDTLLHDAAALATDTPALPTARAYLLHWLAVVRTPASLRRLADLVVAYPPDDSRLAGVALGPLFQQRDYDVDALFPRLFDALSAATVAPLIIDLANYVTRQRLTAQHPATSRWEPFADLLGNLVGRLGALQTHPDPEASPQQLALMVEDGVALAVALCDALALIGNAQAIGKLYQALQLPHRRLRVEAAAALAKLGEETGKETLLQLASEPVARLRVLAYAEELDMVDEIDEQFSSPQARAEAELALWLAQPAQFGIPPGTIELFDERELFWPGYSEAVPCYLFRFGYRLGASVFSNIGIVGPVTHAFAADLADLPPDDIYAAFAGWHAEHADIVDQSWESCTADQRAVAARLVERLIQLGYDNPQPIRLGNFFGEPTLVALAHREETDWIVAVDETDLVSCRWETGPRALTDQLAHAILKGRKLLKSFN